MITNIFYDDNGEWFRIKYGNTAKSIQRLCKELRPISTDNETYNQRDNKCESLSDCRSFTYIFNAFKYIQYQSDGKISFNQSNLSKHLSHFLEFHVSTQTDMIDMDSQNELGYNL